MYCLKLKIKSSGLNIIGKRYIESITTPLRVRIFNYYSLYTPVSNKKTAIPKREIIVKRERTMAIVMKYPIALSIGTARETRQVTTRNIT